MAAYVTLQKKPSSISQPPRICCTAAKVTVELRSGMDLLNCYLPTLAIPSLARRVSV